MNVFIKTLAGDLFTVSYPLDQTEADLPFLVYQVLRAQGLLQGTPLHHLRLIPAEESEEEEKVFYLLVEDPKLQVRFYYHDSAILLERDQDQDQDQNQDQKDQAHEDEDEEPRDYANQEMEVYLLRVMSQENILFEHYFYTPVAYVGTVDEPRKRYSNIYYHEDAVEVVYNPSFEARIQGAGSFREVELRSGATAHYLPSAFALSHPYAEVIAKEMDRVWMEHVRRTGEPHLYSVQQLYSYSD
jgi:hypothetical protein